MEIGAPVASNIVCFRYKPSKLGEAELEKLNKLIFADISKRSFLMISDTTIKGKYLLRACNVNHRTKRQDLEFLVDEVRKTGARISSQAE